MNFGGSKLQPEAHETRIQSWAVSLGGVMRGHGIARLLRRCHGCEDLEIVLCGIFLFVLAPEYDGGYADQREDGRDDFYHVFTHRSLP